MIRRFAWINFAFCLVFAASVSGSNQAQAAPKPLVIILLPGTTLSEWRQADAPNLHQLMAAGALAVMNTRTARLPSDRRRESPESASLTLGAGSRAAGGPELTNFGPPIVIDSQTSVTLGALYTRHIGRDFPPGRWVNPDWPRVVRENQDRGYDLLPGNLGDALETRGIAIRSGGGRLSYPIACTSDGTVQVSPTPSATLQNCWVIDAGSDILTADILIGKMKTKVTASHGRLMILSPCVSDRDYAQGKRLAPVLLWGPAVPPGMLFSPSTHRAGLVVNTDFAWTVTAYFGATETNSWLPTQPFGRPWSVTPTPNALQKVMQIERQSYAQADAQRILPAVAIVLGILVLTGTVFMPAGRVHPYVALLPVVVIDALSVSSSVPKLIIWLAVFTLIAVYLRSRLGAGTTLALGAVGLATTLTGDMAVGDPLMCHSLLGYSAVEGARYYGMGNEAMGALIGAALVGGAWLSHFGRSGRAVAAASFALMTLLLGSPLAGAKAGGLLVAIAGFALFEWTITGRRWTRKTLILLVAVMLSALAFAALGDLRHQSGSQSHMGQAAGRIRVGGWPEAWDIVTRKLAVETRLLYHSAWACPLWTCVFGLLKWKWKRGMDAKTGAKALLYSGGAAMTTCLAVNDAGVVAAALCGVIVWSGLSVPEKGTSLRPKETQQFLLDTGLPR